jgi:hypothetical protein
MLRSLYSLATVIVALSIHSTAQAQASFNFSVNDGGFTASVLTGSATGPWTYGATSWSTLGLAAVSSKGLTSPVLTVGANGSVTGSFTHRFSFEATSFDGGQLQFSVNGGSFNTVPQDQITGVTYSANISTGFSSPIAGQRAFANLSAGFATPSFVTSNFTLGTGVSPFLTGSPFAFTAGDTVEIRFLGAWDSSVIGGNPNWEIGTVDVVNASLAAVPEPTTWALMGTALVGAGGYGYRRFKRKQQPAKTRFNRKK